MEPFRNLSGSLHSHMGCSVDYHWDSEAGLIGKSLALIKEKFYSTKPRRICLIQKCKSVRVYVCVCKYMHSILIFIEYLNLCQIKYDM